MTEPELSRRAQNRAEAFSAIHLAAYELTVQEGCLSATIETISRKAGVSPRTFFNYFRSKEEAILGIRTPEVHVAQLTALAQGGTQGLFQRVLILLQEVVRESIVEDAELSHRKKIYEILPETRERMRTHMVACENAVQKAIEENFHTGVLQNEVLASQPDPHGSARALIVLAGAVFRFTYERAPFDLGVASTTANVEESLDIFKKILKETL